jgi:hypothetical protein
MPSSSSDWQLRVVEGVNGGRAVRFLAPSRHGLIEIPEEAVWLAAQLLLTARDTKSAPDEAAL